MERVNVKNITFAKCKSLMEYYMSDLQTELLIYGGVLRLPHNPDLHKQGNE